LREFLSEFDTDRLDPYVFRELPPFHPWFLKTVDEVLDSFNLMMMDGITLRTTSPKLRRINLFQHAMNQLKDLLPRDAADLLLSREDSDKFVSMLDDWWGGALRMPPITSFFWSISSKA